MMVAQKIIIHPITGESLNKRAWAKKLGISPTTFAKRLDNNYQTAFTPGRLTPSKLAWTPEEDDYLISVARVPNLQKHWNKTSKSNGWQQRSIKSLNTRIWLLQQQQLLDGRRHLEEAEGWVTMSQLAQCLGISNFPVRDWMRNGLKSTRTGECLRSPIKIHLQDFVVWACSPSGSGQVIKAIENNRIALSWLLVQIGNWMPEVKHKSRLIA